MEAYLWVETIVIAVLRVAVIGHGVHVFETAIPSGVSAEGALVVDSPREDLVVVCERDAVHAASGNFNDAD